MFVHYLKSAYIPNERTWTIPLKERSELPIDISHVCRCSAFQCTFLSSLLNFDFSTAHERRRLFPLFIFRQTADPICADARVYVPSAHPYIVWSFTPIRSCLWKHLRASSCSFIRCMRGSIQISPTIISWGCSLFDRLLLMVLLRKVSLFTCVWILCW